MKITWHGHSAFELQDSMITLIDPFLTGNTMADITADEIDPDVIAVTHGHADHMGDTLNIAKRTGCKVVAMSEIAKYLQSQGVDASGGNIGGTIEIGAKYTFVPAMHSNGIDEAGFGWDAGSPAGIVVSDDVAVYHAGDTALFGDMTLIHELYKPKVAMLPIGGRFTMDVSQALLAVKMIRPQFVLPMHYNTFDVIRADAGKFQRLVEDQTDAEVIIMEPGDSIDV
ncbi:MAG TPA: metal-dependent hydrolase [Methanocella sp.]|jgi:L-ascorbate metabolism protein UlaG (beta-lactamase superfamily)